MPFRPHMTVLEQIAALDSGELSAVELVTGTLHAIDAAETTIGAYKIVRHEQALAEAAVAEIGRAHV